MTMAYISDNAGTLYKVGNARDGAEISYLQCTWGKVVIDAITFMSVGTSSACSHITLGPGTCCSRFGGYGRAFGSSTMFTNQSPDSTSLRLSR